MVCMRVPAYSSAAERADYWRALAGVVRGTREKRIVFVGDMNADPDSLRAAGGREMATLKAEGWQVPRAMGPWSYCSSRVQSRIDHAIVSPNLVVDRAAYCPSVGDVTCAGNAAHLSDHAPLLVEISVPLS